MGLEGEKGMGGVLLTWRVGGRGGEWFVCMLFSFEWCIEIERAPR